MTYVEQMQSLISKTIFDIAFIYTLIFFIVGVVWIAPLCYFKKKRNNQKNAKILKKSMIAQASITVICLLFSLITISSFQDINNMKKDIDNNSFVTYVGDYDIDNTYHFTKDYVFSSPSYAAGVVMGRNANGKTEWKTTDHKTINDIENI